MDIRVQQKYNQKMLLFKTMINLDTEINLSFNIITFNLIQKLYEHLKIKILNIWIFD